ncbi:MAG: helix-turn-helix domain-containing protein [Alphaproteobacteria bacterium]|nr:helix-turn-helix domain-containing protein [Alphaproteobacteria bacterium]
MLLVDIGARLRSRRKSLGLTQSELAERAGVSPRFLVQLESGRGNISVQRLAEVCTVLALPLSELFAGLGPAAPVRLALVGLRGAGKSTVGAAVADSLGVPFVELDRRVEDTAGMTLGEVFELGGEARYRALEREALDALLAGGGPFVLAAGGSLVTAAETWAHLRGAARTAWLQARPASHLERVRAQGDLRPMRGRPDALGELRDILAERAPLYALADLHLDTDLLGVGGSVARLVDACGGRPDHGAR